MCGIAGLMDLRARRVTAQLIEGMNEAQRHRGPDDWGGVLLDIEGKSEPVPWGGTCVAPREPARLGLGHVRLSIIDLTAAGHQPMCSKNGHLWLVYNGEIYNYIELRAELERLGFRFDTKTDTEVVLAAYEAWGLDAFRRFNGMWGLAIWDGKLRRLVCSRDRMGVKPFHYAESDGLFAFASEIPALLTLGSIDRRADAGAVARFLSWAEMPPADRTYFSGVRRLPAGHLLVLQPNRRSELTRWWTPPEARGGITFEAAAEQLRATFVDAVRLRLRSDVPVGVCLSGGLDSSAVACTMRHVQGRAEDISIRAFTARFQDPGFDESDYAREVVRSVGAEWHVVEPSASDLKAGDLLHLIRAQAEPFPNLSMYAQFCLFRSMRGAGVPVALDGQGADELLWGYTWHYALMLGYLARSAQFGRFAQESLGVLRNNHLSSKARLLVALGYYGVPYAREVRSKLLHNGGLTRECRYLAGEPSERGFGPGELATYRNHEVFQDPLPALLRYEDRSSMAFSIESRLPFLDYRLVELALSIEESQLIRDGWSKALLRAAMKGVLPERIRWRRSKLGFDAPSPRLVTAVAPLVREAFARPRLGGLVGPKVVLDPLEHDTPLPPLATRAIIAELWMREFAVSFDTASPSADALQC